MFAVVGASGKTGGAVVQRLLAEKRTVRAIVHREASAAALREQGVEVFVADAADREALARAFDGADAIYAMNPPAYLEPDLIARAAIVHSAIIGAARSAGVGRVVALSSVGGQHAAGTGNIVTTHDFEAQLAPSGLAYTVLRAANFLDNWAWALAPAMSDGVLPSMLLPLDRRIPSVAARDVGDTAATLMLEDGPSGRMVELHGPEDYSPNDAAAALSSVLGRLVQAVAVPAQQWKDGFLQQGMPERSARAFVEMYAGFNSGLIAFEGTGETRRGTTSLHDTLAALAGSVV